MAAATCPPSAKSEEEHRASQKVMLLAMLPGQSHHRLGVWEERSQLLTPHHWLLGEGELSTRLRTPRISIEVTRGGGVISLSVWDSEPEPLLNWGVCGTLRVSGLNSVWWSFLSSPVDWGRLFPPLRAELSVLIRGLINGHVKVCGDDHHSGRTDTHRASFSQKLNSEVVGLLQSSYGTLGPCLMSSQCRVFPTTWSKSWRL